MTQPTVVAASAGPASRVLTRSHAPEPLSKRLWDLDWSRILPWQFEDVTVDSSTFDEALPFVAEHYARIFGQQEGPARFLVEPMTLAKRRFSAEMDVFVFRADGKVIGVVMSHPSDWSTYYMRTAALLPEYRGRKIMSWFSARTCEVLRDAGVSRVEADVSPTNLASMKLHVAQGFIAASTMSSERWGLVVRFTKFLREENQDIFARQFSGIALKGPAIRHPPKTK